MTSAVAQVSAACKGSQNRMSTPPPQHPRESKELQALPPGWDKPQNSAHPLPQGIAPIQNRPDQPIQSCPQQTMPPADLLLNVYSIFSAQCLASLLVCMAFIYSQTARDIMLRSPLGGWKTMMVQLRIRCCTKGAPKGKYLILCLVLLLSLDIAAACSVLSSAGLGMLVAKVVVLTSVMFITLTAFAWSNQATFVSDDFVSARPLLFLILGGILSRLFGSAVLDVLVSWCGAAVFSVHIMYDTRRLATMRNGCDCASRAFELYLSTMVVFLDILALAEAA